MPKTQGCGYGKLVPSKFHMYSHGLDEITEMLFIRHYTGGVHVKVWASHAGVCPYGPSVARLRLEAVGGEVIEEQVPIYVSNCAAMGSQSWRPAGANACPYMRAYARL
jgi:hypothetical protein